MIQSEYQNAPLMSNKNFWFRILLIIAAILLCIWISSCSGSRKMVKSETKYDSTAIIKTETKKDSIVNTSTVTKTEKEVNNNIQSEDNYTEETIETTKLDTSGKPVEKVITKKRKGKLSASDLSKTNIKNDIKDTTASRYTEDKKEDNKTTVSKGEKKKDVKSNYKFCFGNIALGLGVIIGLALLAYFIYRKFKRKVMDGDS